MFNETTSSVLSSLGNISADIFGVLGVLILLVALGLTKGKKTLLVVLLALYPTALVTHFFPFYGGIPFVTGTIPLKYEPLVLFVLALVASIFIIKNYIETTYQLHTFWLFVEVISLAITIAGLGIAILYHFVEVDSIYTFSVLIDSLFVSPIALFLWILAPLINISLFIRS